MSTLISGARFFGCRSWCLLLLLFWFPALGAGTDDFITTWKTDNPGTSGSTQVTIPTNVLSTYNYNVDWGDGNSDSAVTGDITHTYAAAGTYTVTIEGTFPRIYFNNGGDAQKILTVEQWGTGAWNSMNGAFYGASNLVINATDAPDVSAVTNMNDMFNGASSLVDNGGAIGTWNTSAVINMRASFKDAALFDGAIGAWNTAAVTNMASLFEGAAAFNQNISGWNIAGVTSLENVFNGAAVFDQPIGTWNTTAVTSLDNTFNGAVAFDQDISGWNVSSVTDISSAFNGATSFDQNISGWDVSGVDTFSFAFAGATAFDQPIGTWTTTSLNNLNNTFDGASAFNQSLSGWNVSGVTTMNSTFRDATAFDGDITGWNVSSVINFSNFLQRATAFSQDLSAWTPTSATNFSNMFDAAANFNANVGGWNVSAGVDFGNMFDEATSFDQDISGWNMVNAEDISAMFAGATAFDQNIGGWNTASVTSMQNLFNGATTFDQDISGWNVGAVTRMDSMFRDATAFNQNISGWNMSGVLQINNMFYGATAFNQPIGTWNLVSNQNLNNIFRGATAFNQDISGWNTASVTSMQNTFRDATAFNQDISGWNVTTSTTFSNMFNGATAFDQDLSSWDISNATTLTAMFTSAPISRANYDAMLAAWDALSLPSGKNITVGGKYCLSSANRANIIASDSWTITDDGIDCEVTPVITAPTKIRNLSMTDTTIQVTDLVGVLAANVVVDGATTATTSSFSCGQTSATQVDCTISIDSPGDLTITATNTSGNVQSVTESNYVFDTTAPTISTAVDTATNGVDMPIFTFTPADNIAVDRVDIIYNIDDGLGGTVGGATTLSSAVSPATITFDPDEPIHTATLRVYDTAGNSTDSVLLFPPTVVFTTPTLISNVAINDSTVTVTSPTGNDITNIALTPGTTGASLGTCTGFGGDLTSPYAQPVSCIISGVSTTGTLMVSAEDDGNGAVGQNNQAYTIDTVDPAPATFTAPTKAAGAAITDTTFAVLDDTGINSGDVSFAAINTTGAFSISNQNCVQTNAARVDCTLQVDANDGTGDVQATATDVAGNTIMVTEAGYVVDLTAPGTPAAAPDLQAGSDTGSSSIDDLTQNTIVNFDVACTEVGSAITVYTDNPSVLTVSGTHACVGVGTEAVSSSLTVGANNITYTEADVYGNTSAASPALVVTLDTTAPADGVFNAISSDNGTTDLITNDQTLIFSGTAEANSTVEVFIDAGSIGNTTTDGSGDWSLDHTGTTLAAATYAITTQVTDTAGNTGNVSAGANVEIDLTTPSDAVITTPASGLPVDGTAEVGSVVTVTVTPSRAPATTPSCTTTVGIGGTWSCSLSPSPAAGESIDVVVTDPGGNVSGTATTVLNIQLDQDGDGLTDQEEALIGTDPNTVGLSTDSTDSQDADPVTNAVEVRAPNSGDANGDGTVDAVQAHVASITNSIDVTAYNTLEIDNEATCPNFTQVLSDTESNLAAADTSRDYPIGVWDFTIDCGGNIGATANMKILLDKEYTDAASGAWTLRKFDPNTNTYADVTGAVFGTESIGGTTVTTITYSVTDGGPLDADGLANGIIRDPVGPSAATPVTGFSGGGAATRTYAPLGEISLEKTPEGFYASAEEEGISCEFEDKNISSRRGLKINSAWFRINDMTVPFDTEVLEYYEAPANGLEAPAKIVKLTFTGDFHEYDTKKHNKIQCGIADVFGIKAGQEVLLEADSEGSETETAISTDPKTGEALLESAPTCETRQYTLRQLKTAQNKFSDFSAEHRAYEGALHLLNNDVVHGDGNGLENVEGDSIRLDDPISRAEMAKLLVRATERPVKVGSCLQQNYNDVDLTEWYAPYVEVLHNEGIVNGQSARRYSPAQSVKASELYKFVSLTFGYEEYSLLPGEKWYMPYRDVLAEYELLPAWFSDLPADQDVTRGDVFALISNTIKHQKKLERERSWWLF